MEQKQLSNEILRKKKLLMVMPLIVLPFITLLFWALGGGKINKGNKLQALEGLNMQLPAANLNEVKPQDKLGYYDKATSDSLKRQELLKNDPYYKAEKTDQSPHFNSDTSLIEMKNKSAYSNLNNSPYNNSSNSDPNETKVYKKLTELNTALNDAASKETKTDEDKNHLQPANPVGIDGGDADRLEQMMQTMSQKNGDDPEMQQLNLMIDKILDMQHPERLQEKIQKTSEAKKGHVFAVSANNVINPISFLGNDGNRNRSNDTGRKYSNLQNSFYSLDGASAINQNANAIQAVIHETQIIVDGSTVKLQLVSDVYINGVLIPANNFVFGTAALSGERLGITIHSIRYNNSLFPVELSVFDMDGMSGLYIPGAITRDVAKQSAEQGLQDIGFTSLNPSIGTKATSAGIQAAKTLLSKKVKLIKVTVKAGYQVLLYDEKQKQNS